MAVLKPDWSFHYPDVFSGSSSHLRVVLHLVACIASLGLGLRLSREFSCSVYQLRPQLLSEGTSTGGLRFMIDSELVNRRNMTISPPGKSSNVHPGRHRILIRPWPHPDPRELAAAQAIIERVQQEQRKQYQAEHRSQGVVVITTVTHHSKCPLKALHMTALASSLTVARHAVTWIVVEGRGEGDLISEILKRTPVKSFDVKSDHISHAQLRIQGLRFVRDNKLEGMIVFLDQLDTPSLDLFDEVQKMNMAATFALGFPVVGNSSQQDAGETSMSVLVHRPVCDRIRGWEVVSGSGTRQQTLTSGWWSGVAFHSKLLSLEYSGRVADLDEWEHLQENATLVGNLTGLIRDESMLEHLEGEEPLVWSPRLNDYPSTCMNNTSFRLGSWMIHPPLEVVVESRKTPWSALGYHTSAQVPPGRVGAKEAVQATIQTTTRDDYVDSAVEPVPKVTRHSKKSSPRSVRKKKRRNSNKKDSIL